jgi:hypothetical protein
MTTFTSNNNQFGGKVTTSKQSFNDKYEYSDRGGCGGYAILAVLVIVAIVLFTVVIPALS